MRGKKKVKPKKILPVIEFDSCIRKAQHAVLRQYDRIGEKRTLEELANNSQHRFDCGSIMHAIQSLVKEGKLEQIGESQVYECKVSRAHI